eukprot:3046014-Rhodomonas_salina.1
MDANADGAGRVRAIAEQCCKIERVGGSGCVGEWWPGRQKGGTELSGVNAVVAVAVSQGRSNVAQGLES